MVRTIPERLLSLTLALACLASVPPAEAASHTSLSSGVQHVELLVEPDDGLGAITRAIRRANSSIRLTMYILTDHSVIRALEFAHAVGVDVRVILEPHPYGSSSSTNLYAYNNLLAADIPVRWSSARYALTHEKSMLIDSTTAYIMTTNFTRAAFRANREFDVIDRDRREADALSALFAADWAGRPYTPADPNLVTSPTNARATRSTSTRRSCRTAAWCKRSPPRPAATCGCACCCRRQADPTRTAPRSPRWPPPGSRCIAWPSRSSTSTPRPSWWTASAPSWARRTSPAPRWTATASWACC